VESNWRLPITEKKEITKNIEWQGWKVIDLGNVTDIDEEWNIEKDPPTASGIKCPRRVGAATKQLFQKIKREQF